MTIRKLATMVEEVLLEGGAPDGEPLRKAVAMAVITNPYIGRLLAPDLDELIEPSRELGRVLGERVSEALAAPVESYGKGAVVGLDGEQEHAVACITSAFGDQLREAVGGGRAWLSSVTKRCGAGEPVDIPLAFKDEIWVRSHYDAITVRLPDAPLPDEILVICAVASRGRLHARLGGKTVEQAMAEIGA